MQPSNRTIRITAAAVLVTGLAVCAAAIYAEQLGLSAGEEARGQFGWKQISLLVVGLILAGPALVAIVRPRIVDWERVGEYVLDPPRRHVAYLGIGLLGLLGLTLVWTRLIDLDQSLWHDEAHTIVNWSSVGLGPILFGEGEYSINNHVLYNLLSWATTGALGESEAMYRLWSVLPGIAAIAIATWWAWRRLGPVVAIAFAALVVAAPQHMELAPQARGYGLALLAATLMLIAADRLVRAYSRGTLLGFVGAGLLGIWTLHVFAVAFVGQALALLKSPKLRRPAIAAVALAGLLSILFYAPVLRDVLAESRPRGETIPLGDALVLERPIGWFVVPSFTLPLEVEQARWMGGVVLALIAVGIVGLWRRGDLGLALILVVPPLVFNLFISLSGLTTVTRHQFLLLTHILILVAVGIGVIGRLVTRLWPLRVVAVAAGIVAVVALANATLDRQQDLRPFENFSEAANVARWTELEPVVTDSMRPDSLRYYLGDDVAQIAPEAVEALLCERRRPLVYIRHVPVSPLADDYLHPASLRCLRGEDAVRIRVPQRGRGRAIDVWIVNPPRRGREILSGDIHNAPVPWIERVWGVAPAD